jgi:hypothetical protein
MILAEVEVVRKKRKLSNAGSKSATLHKLKFCTSKDAIIKQFFVVSFILARGLQGDVVYLSWPIAPKCGGEGEVVGSRPMRTTVHIT